VLLNPQSWPPLAPLSGNFANPGFGKAVLRVHRDTAAFELLGSGAKLHLDSWDGDVTKMAVV
jgi:hypothetical protein